MVRCMPVIGREIINHRVVRTLVVFSSESVVFFSGGVVELIKRSSSSSRGRRRKDKTRGAPLRYRHTHFLRPLKPDELYASLCED